MREMDKSDLEKLKFMAASAGKRPIELWDLLLNDDLWRNAADPAVRGAGELGPDEVTISDKNLADKLYWNAFYALKPERKADPVPQAPKEQQEGVISSDVFEKFRKRRRSSHDDPHDFTKPR